MNYQLIIHFEGEKKKKSKINDHNLLIIVGHVQDQMIIEYTFFFPWKIKKQCIIYVLGYWRIMIKINFCAIINKIIFVMMHF